MRISLHKLELELLPAPAIWIASERVLIIADTHFGKSAAFRNQGLAVPDGELKEDLDRISQLIEKYRPGRFIVAGDFLHSPHGLDEGVDSILRTWSRELKVTIEVATGNHDRRAGRIDCDQILYSQEIEVAGLKVIHDPGDFSESDIGLCGHLHPVISVKSGKRTRLRLPAFWLKNGKHLIMPSFGSLTGGQMISPRKNDKVFGLLGSETREIPLKLCSKHVNSQ